MRSDLVTGPDTSCLSTSVTTPEPYWLSFVVGGLLATEATIAAPGPDRLRLMWAAMCQHYMFVAEFAQEVLRDHYLLGVSRLVSADFERVWDSKALWHAELEETRPQLVTRAKLRTEIGHMERSKTAADQKRADANRKALTECEDYERDVLFPLASRRPAIALDDGALVNYPRFGAALQKIPSIDKKRRDVQTRTWPTHPITPQEGTQ
ncbi:BrxA family protein [Actinomyces wuliandei]|uniref:BrxA family protein n=1 Tax=Actinomyces wuliandei TaxID=2057743 RepID=UPI00111A96CA|nr:BrxA family protein [Actinomyces wuliandei]